MLKYDERIEIAKYCILFWIIIEIILFIIFYIPKEEFDYYQNPFAIFVPLFQVIFHLLPIILLAIIAYNYNMRCRAKIGKHIIGISDIEENTDFCTLEEPEPKHFIVLMLGKNRKEYYAVKSDDLTIGCRYKIYGGKPYFIKCTDARI
jgi:hypothetical protein